MTDTITVRFLGSERVFDLAALVGHYRLFIGDLLFEIGAGNQVVWFASFANLTEFAETPQEAASKLEESIQPLAKLLAPLGIPRGPCWECDERIAPEHLLLKQYRNGAGEVELAPYHSSCFVTTQQPRESIFEIEAKVEGSEA